MPTTVNASVRRSTYTCIEESGYKALTQSSVAAFVDRPWPSIGLCLSVRDRPVFLRYHHPRARRPRAHRFFPFANFFGFWCVPCRRRVLSPFRPRALGRLRRLSDG